MTRDTYGDADGHEVVEELQRLGLEPDEVALYNLMKRLIADGYAQGYANGYGEPRSFSMLRLSTFGREEARDVDRSLSRR